MTIKKIASFDKISQRILYGLKCMYSDFISVESDKADAQSQQKLHGLMESLIDKLYETPELLTTTDCADEAWEWYTTNNSKPALDKAYKSIFKELYDFYQFLYIAFARGETNHDCLTISGAALRESKASYKPQHNILLSEIGMRAEKGKTVVTIYAENSVLQSLRLLAERIPLNPNPWTPYALINFVCCSFTGDFSYLLSRVDHAADLNGLLHEIRNNCMENGYEEDIRCSLGSSGAEFRISFHHAVGGFVIGYSPRKYWQFYFGSLNSIGVKAMLEDFENLDRDLQKHFIDVCKTCNGCLGCTKGRSDKTFAAKVQYDGKEHTLCPDNFARHDWETIDHDLATVLFKYHAAQEIYGSDWKKK